jgi:hypothetical protein
MTAFLPSENNLDKRIDSPVTGIAFSSLRIDDSAEKIIT